MKKGYWLLLCVMLCGLGNLYAQTQGSDGNLTVIDILDPNGTNNALVFGRRYPTVEGSPYVLQDWSKGVIYRKTGAPLEGITLHFDIYSQELLVKEEGKVMTVIPAAVKGFKLYHLEGEDMVFARNPRIEKDKFFQQVFQGRNELWKGYEVALTKQENNAGGYGQGGNATEIQRFNRKERWYLFQEGNTEPISFKATKKDLLESFPNRASDIKAFLKSNKLKLTQDGDWIAVMNFIEKKSPQEEG